MEKGRRIQRMRNAGAHALFARASIQFEIMHMDECAGVRRVCGLVAALEISPPSQSRRRVQRLEIKSRHGKIYHTVGFNERLGKTHDLQVVAILQCGCTDVMLNTCL